MAWFYIRCKNPVTGWYKLSVSVKVNCWIMEQDSEIWKWPSVYNGTDNIDVSPELLFVIALKFNELEFPWQSMYYNSV